MTELESEELDRELIDRAPTSPFFGQVVKIKVGKRALTFTTKHGDSIQFFRHPDLLKITTKKVTKITQTCSMGHLHETGKREDVYEFFAIDFEMIEQLHEWAQQGAWVSPRKKEP